jgi:hypothetical protein
MMATLCKSCKGSEVESIVQAFGYTVYGCLTCGAVWIRRRIPYKTGVPGSKKAG